jgi:hypothetical protein
LKSQRKEKFVMVKPSKIDRAEAEVAIRNGDAPKSLQQAREMIAILLERTAKPTQSVAPVTPSAPLPVPAPQPQPPPRPSGPRQGEPRYPSIIRGQMLAERDGHRLFQLYREHQESEKFYGKYSNL